MSFEWKGIFPALLTPFTNDDGLDIPMFEKNLEAQLEAGVQGVIIGGSLGEASTITEKEKEELTERKYMTLSKRKIKKAKAKYINGRSLTRKEANILAKRWGYSQYYYSMNKLNKNIMMVFIRA